MRAIVPRKSLCDIEEVIKRTGRMTVKDYFPTFAPSLGDFLLTGVPIKMAAEEGTPGKVMRAKNVGEITVRD